jgi:dipeptidyl aminopeptidase/acylaminoacyl peptidase
VFVYAAADGRVVAAPIEGGRAREIASGASASDIDVDRDGARLLFAIAGSPVASRHLVTGKVEPLCAEGYPDYPASASGPAFSPSGDRAVFVTKTAAGDRTLHVALGSRVCVELARGILAADWAPGRDRLVVAEQDRVAVISVAAPVSGPASVRLMRDVLRLDGETVRDLSVDRGLARVAILTDRFLRVRPLGGTAQPLDLRLPEFAADGSAPKGVAAVFSPDGAWIAVAMAAASETTIRVVRLDDPGANAWKILDLDPPPAPAAFAWPTRLLHISD